MATVICPKCGHKVALPEHGYDAHGHVLGKDDAGHYELQMEEEQAETYDAYVASQSLTNSNNNSTMATSKKEESAKKVGIMTGEERDILMALFEKLKNDPECKQMVRDIFKDIDDDGYLKVDGVIRQWIPAQVLNNLRGELGRDADHPLTFHEHLTQRSYRYAWKVLADELWRQCAMLHQGDDEAFADRNRFFNIDLAVNMACDYISGLEQHWEELKVCRHAGREYKKLKVSGINNGKGIHCDEFVCKVTNVLSCLVSDMERADTFRDQYDVVMEFYAWVKRIHWKPAKMNRGFVNVYKASGAYYTLKDLIMYEGVKLKVKGNGSIAAFSHWGKWVGDVDREESLALLEEYVNGISDIYDYGYLVMGLLKDVIRYNEFDIKNTLIDWRVQSENRREERKMHQRRRLTSK